MEVAVFMVLLNASHIATPSVEKITTAIAADTTPSPSSSAGLSTLCITVDTALSA